MHKAVAEVKQYADEQKFKRENPSAALKNVKSKVAGNMKSIEKAKKREKLKREAELDSPDNLSPMSKSLKFVMEQKAKGYSP